MQSTCLQGCQISIGQIEDGGNGKGKGKGSSKLWNESNTSGWSNHASGSQRSASQWGGHQDHHEVSWAQWPDRGSAWASRRG